MSRERRLRGGRGGPTRRHPLARPFAGIDFFPDLPHGLSTNNSSVTRDLNGKGGVRDVGEKSPAEVREAPTRGYKPTLKPEDIKDGHTYCFLVADGEHYAKLHAIKFVDH
jgi:hypothetical protein